MRIRTIPEQIEANKRASLFYALLLVVLLAGLGTVIVGVYAPDVWFYGTAGATALGLTVSLVALSKGSDIVLAIGHARVATPEEDQVLHNVVEEMALAAGLPMPKIYVVDDEAPNAFATGRDPEHSAIAVTTGLIHKLNRDELQGVVGHEMGHIRNNDIRFMTSISLIAGLIPLLADVFLRMQWFGLGRSRDRDRGNNDGLGTIFMIVGFVLAILAPIFSVLLNMAVSRQREFMADSTSAQLTRYPEGLASALEKISADPTRLRSSNRAMQHMYIVSPRLLRSGTDLYSSHPSTAERVAALRGSMGSFGPPPKPPILSPQDNESQTTG
jgi:heat shock protein HtpX